MVTVRCEWSNGKLYSYPDKMTCGNVRYEWSNGKLYSYPDKPVVRRDVSSPIMVNCTATLINLW